MSPAALRAVFSPDADDDLILLVTIYDPVDNVTVLTRLADGYTKRISETDTDVIYGVTSGGVDYTFLPMSISLPSEEEAQAPKCSITLHDVTRYVIPIIRTISAPPRVKLEMVLTSTPDNVEVTFNDFYISNFNYTATSVSADLSMIDYEREPFPMHSFTPAYFPGMF